MTDSPIDRARALWGVAGSSEPASAPQTSPEEYLTAIEEQEKEENAFSVHQRMLEKVAAAPRDSVSPGQFIPANSASGQATVAMSTEQWSHRNDQFISLDTWEVQLGKFHWSLNYEEQAEVRTVLREALRRHLEEEHSHLMDEITPYADEVTPVESASEVDA